MPRVKRGKHAIKRRRKTLSQAKGYRFGRKSKERLAREAILHAGRNAFRDRRKKKGAMRATWHVQINAAVRPHDISYSDFMGRCKEKNIGLNRKMLSTIAQNHPSAFKEIIKAVTK